MAKKRKISPEMLGEFMKKRMENPGLNEIKLSDGRIAKEIAAIPVSVDPNGHPKINGPVEEAHHG